ncbi:MAG TPA: HPr family phosphocarrier protein [Pseudogracilibacillus sp.]|nr:HPr family phosphocarrier protein [Pseudogracilibacillus sp.]
MLERSLTVELESGLQARPAAQFVQEANKFEADLFLEKDGKRINAKSIMGLMTLALAKGEEVSVIADGPDESNAMEQLTQFISSETVQ